MPSTCFPSTYHLARVSSPIGALTLVASGDTLVMVRFAAPGEGAERELETRAPGATIRAHSDPAGAATALKSYFAGDLHALDRVQVDPWGTPFQRRVWTTLRSVPAGQTASYAEVARRIGTPTAVRAVGTANGANPIAIIVPCHRIIGSSGSLVGYGGGVQRKRWLLQHEGVLLSF
jgi:methylated-DNA-[protein]-cysteine S-methyltransferase